MPAQSPVRGRMALIAASLAGLLLLFVLGTVFSSGPVIEAGGTVPAARVEISEYMTSNGSAYPDGNGLFSDWVELHNTTGSRISSPAGRCPTAIRPGCCPPVPWKRMNTW